MRYSPRICSRPLRSLGEPFVRVSQASGRGFDSQWTETICYLPLTLLQVGQLW